MKFLASLVSLAALATLAAASPAPQDDSGSTASTTRLHTHRANLRAITIYSQPNNGGDSETLTNDGTCTSLSGNAPIRSVQISGSVRGCGLFRNADCSDRESVVFQSRSSLSGDAVAIGCQ
ncbi:hypothetical protein BDV10DRAFT_184856 [Aspergillus recurvatus]